MNQAKQFIEEWCNVVRLLPRKELVRWHWCLVAAAREVFRSRSLGAVDRMFGDRFRIRSSGGLFTVSGASLGVFREIFGRECYVTRDEIQSAQTIIDLGANCGAFSLFALTHAPRARVIAVEAQPAFAEVAKTNLETNGFTGRFRMMCGFVGAVESEWARSFSAAHPDVLLLQPSDWMPGEGEVDFLKCDIEGAEYALFGGDVSWLRRVRRIALEYHGDWPSGNRLGERIRQLGFEIQQAPHGRLGYLFGKRNV